MGSDSNTPQSPRHRARSRSRISPVSPPTAEAVTVCAALVSLTLIEPPCAGRSRPRTGLYDALPSASEFEVRLPRRCSSGNQGVAGRIRRTTVSATPGSIVTWSTHSRSRADDPDRSVCAGWVRSEPSMPDLGRPRPGDAHGRRRGLARRQRRARLRAPGIWHPARSVTVIATPLASDSRLRQTRLNALPPADGALGATQARRLRGGAVAAETGSPADPASAPPATAPAGLSASPV